MYRLLADVLNDTAFVLDCLSPNLPKAIRVVVLSFSSVLRALCGVAADSAKASLSAHFARWGNLGELNAKDSSQETVISLLGMLAGSLVVSWITTPFATWTTLLLLLSIHLETNRRAVRAVSMRTLNRQRARLVFHHLKRGHVPTPEEISRQERIFEWDGVLRDANDNVLGRCHIGSSMFQFLKDIGSHQHRQTKSTQLPHDLLRKIVSSFHEEPYLMWYNLSGKDVRVSVVIKKHAKASNLIVAWWQALMLMDELNFPENPPSLIRATATSNTPEKTLELLESSIMGASGMMVQYEAGLRKAGWDLDLNAVETTSSTRVTVQS